MILLHEKFGIDVTFEMRTAFYKSHLFNDKLEVIARFFCIKTERRGKEQGGGETKCERESVCV
jgi:hypothetical protein